MSKADPPRRSDVGYRRPPKDHQFRKGVSGDPKGRPRRKSAQKSSGLVFSDQRANQLLLEEAYRLVSIREGSTLMTLPLIQAVYRSLGVAAVKGNRTAQKLIADSVQKIETSVREDRVENLTALMSYKSDWEARIDQARELGQVVPRPVPHPDDIIIDFDRGEATICGPKTKEEKAEWDRLLDYRDTLQRLISDMAERFEKVGPGESKDLYLQAWKDTQLQYDRTNDNLPSRYRRDLNDRCWEDDASRPGSQKTVTWSGEL
jgi:hypothetical protein